MKENILSYTTRIGKTTFIVNVKQSESAKKPLNTVFQEICRHEMLGNFSADKYLNLENLKNHLDKLVPEMACVETWLVAIKSVVFIKYGYFIFG